MAETHPEFDPYERAPYDTEDGSAILYDVEHFLRRFVAYPSEAALIAHTLWIGHTHRMDIWDSTPRIAFLSPEAGSGKSRALEVTDLLVPNPVQTINISPAYLFRRIADRDSIPTVLFDEVDTVFGTRAGNNEEIRALLNAGHRKGAVTGRCAVRGTTVVLEELDAYCAVALAGIGDLPDTIMTRSIVVRMQRRSPSEHIDPFRDRLYEVEGHRLRDDLAKWSMVIPDGVWPQMPPEITDRNADVWEALFMVADAAAGEWPARAREAAVTLVTDTSGDRETLGIRLLKDLRTIFGNRDSMFTEDILNRLVAIDDAGWDDHFGKPINATKLGRLLARYSIQSTTIRDSGRVLKGYQRAPLAEAWSRYLPPP